MLERGRSILYHYRHWRRYQEILNVLIKHGLSFVVERLELPGAPLLNRLRNKLPEEDPASLPYRLTEVLQELGPTFIKLGQLLSTRRDLLPEAYITALASLQDKVAPIPFERIAEVISSEIGEPVDKIFRNFDHQALASASIGQVHRARLNNGVEVVVKVQRPGIEPTVKTDLEILHEIGRIVESRSKIGSFYRIGEILDEFSYTLIEELDFTLEGHNADIFQQNFRDDPRIVIPQVFWRYTGRKVLVMEYIDGCKIINREQLLSAGYDPPEIARTLVDAMIKQVYCDGFFHSDPHPGNLALLPGNRVVLMDFGQVGQLDETLRERGADLVLALVRHDLDGIIKGLLKIGMVRGRPNLTRLKRDLSRLERKYYGLPLKEISLGTSVQEIFMVAWHYRIEIPFDFVMTAKALITLEGVVRELAPEMSLVEIAEPFAGKVVRMRYDPRSWRRRVWKEIVNTGSSLSNLPGLFEEVARLAKDGDLVLRIEYPELSGEVNKLRYSIHRLSLSIILASLLIASALLMKVGPASLLIRWHLPEIIIAASLAVSLVLAIALIRDF